MTRLCQLLGSSQEARFECMYTKHKTQKRKTWHDGFVTLSASRKLVLYDDSPAPGHVLDDAKMSVFDWERKDEEYISVPKFLIEIINETPVDGGYGSLPASTNVSSKYTAGSGDATAPMQQAAPRAPSSGNLGGKPRFANTKFRTPVTRGPPRLTRPAGGRGRHPYGRSAPAPSVQRRKATPSPSSASPAFDFARNPTSEWEYVPNAINRTPDEVLVLLDK